jgi:transcription antitermination factor NusG
MSEKAWYIVSTQGIGARGALQIQSLLDRLEYDGLLWSPTLKVPILKYGKTQNNDKTLFPSYVFINTVIDDSKLEQALIEAKIGRFLKLPGETLPTKISEEDIDHIKKLEESDVEPMPEEIISIDIGNLVEICVGPFIGFKGIVTKISGHSASIDTLVFGRSTPVSVNIAHLSKLMETNPNEKENPEA